MIKDITMNLKNTSTSKYGVNPRSSYSNKTSSEDFDDIFTDSLAMFQKEVVSTEMEVYLDEPIRGLPYYRGLIHYMHCMQAEDSLIIWLDTPGGQLDSALAIIDAMETTEGSVQVIVTGEAASAGSLIALSAPNLVLGAKARFMLHSASYSIGHSKQGDIESRVENSKQLLRSVVEDGYKDFLSPEEIELMFIGKDYYMDSSEVAIRLEAREEMQDKRRKQEEVKLKKAAAVSQAVEAAKVSTRLPSKKQPSVLAKEGSRKNKDSPEVIQEI